MTRVAILRYPGTWSERDFQHALSLVEGIATEIVWHAECDLRGFDAAIVPGGFSYGDYLRAGAIAATSPSLKTIQKAAEAGKPVLGICNGFQILVEAGILPGAVLRNTGLRFVCKWTRLRVETTRTPFTHTTEKGQILNIPIAHNEGRYHLDDDELNTLERDQQIVLRYVDNNNEPSPNANPNGSINNIAGICNQDGNVMGLMPHPERASIPILTPNNRPEGRLLFDSMMNSLASPKENVR